MRQREHDLLRGRFGPYTPANVCVCLQPALESLRFIRTCSRDMMGRQARIGGALSLSLRNSNFNESILVRKAGRRIKEEEEEEEEEDTTTSATRRHLFFPLGFFS